MVIEAVVPDDWSLWFRINCGCGNCGTLLVRVTMTAKVFSLPLDGVYEDSVVKDGKEGIFVAIRIVKANGKHWLWGLLIIAFYPPSGGCCWGGGYHFWSASGENIVGIPTEACPFLERNFGLKNTVDMDGKETKNHHRHRWDLWKKRLSKVDCIWIHLWSRAWPMGNWVMFLLMLYKRFFAHSARKILPAASRATHQRFSSEWSPQRIDYLTVFFRKHIFSRGWHWQCHNTTHLFSTPTHYFANINTL